MARTLAKFCKNTTPVTYDPFQDAWRTLRPREAECLFPPENFKPSSRRRPRWTTSQRTLGILQRKALGQRRHFLKGATPFNFLIFPEIISPEISAQFSQLRSHRDKSGIRIGIFHDAIAWKFPEWSAQKTANRYPEYMRSLAELDGVAAVSEASRKDLIAFWDSEGIPEDDRPQTRTIPLGTDAVNRPSIRSQSDSIPTVLCVATLEARKNHIGLLSAAAHLWDSGLEFRLELIGGHNRETGVDAVETVQRFQEAHLPVKWLGVASDEEVQAAYQRADIVAYPSLYEGFGLPVIEALRWGKPVLATNCGSLSEIVTLGGCHVLDDPSAAAIAQGLKRMVSDETYRRKLEAEALKVPLRTWEDHGLKILEFVQDLQAEYQTSARSCR